MNFFTNLKTGLSSYVDGMKFIFKNKLWYYFIFPAILATGIFFLGQYFVSLEEGINEKLKNSNPESLNELIWLNIELVISDSLYVIFTKFNKYIVIIILSPLLAMLSEKMEEIMTGNVYPLNIKQLIHDVKRGMRIAVRNMFWEYFFLIIVIGVAAFFPKGGFKVAMLLSIPMIIGFYYYGFGFIDFINERRRLDIRQSTYFVRNHRGLAFGIGSIYSIVFMLPDILKALMPGAFANTTVYFIVSIPFIALAPIAAMAAATMAMDKIVGLEHNEWAIKKDKVLKGENQKSVESDEETENKNSETTDSEETEANQ